MPGEQLACVWQAVAALDVTKKCAVSAPTEIVKAVTKSISGLQTVNFSEHIFNQTFQDETIKFEDYKIYVKNSLREKGVSFGILLESIEEACWNVIKTTCKSSISNADLYKLWKINNRLVREDTYPPVLCKEEACWFTDKVLGNFGNIIKSTDEMFKADSFIFMDFVKILEDLVFKEVTVDKTKACIDDLYSWLVLEILKKEKVYVRCRKQSNWSTWAKRSCVLTPRSVSVYTGSPDKVRIQSSTKKIELVITKNTKVESLLMYSGIIHHLKGRFCIANHPVIELEIAVEDDYEKRSWLSSVEEIIECILENTTPVQKLLRDRYTKRIKQSSTSITKQSSLQKVETALNENHKRVSRAISNMPSPIRTPVIQLQGIQETADVVTVEIVPKVTTKPGLNGTNGNNTGSLGNNNTTDFIAVNREKLKAVFMKIDTNGNGLLDRTEFHKFIKEIGLTMSEKEVNLVFKTVDTRDKSEITFDEFEVYFSKHVMDETSTAECVNAMRKAFLEADRNGSGTLNFREFTEYVWEKKRSIRMSKIMTSFSESAKDEITFSDFQKMVQGGNSDVLTSIIEEEIEDIDLNDSSVDQFQNQLKQVYSDTDSKELTTYIRDRWKNFATFRRKGNTGTIVMKGGHGMVADLVPGEYSLIDLACFSDLPPLIPKHTVVKGVKWEIGTVPGKSGKITFPPDFNGRVVTDVATTELLRYYDCSFADAKQEKISLLYRHGIQDFTYENGYLEKYVAATNGGAGLERHEFSHLDCPLTDESGTFILTKFTENGEFHITGFKIPKRHTLYIPGGVIHCNDYLKGTWRTMLSDETDIDHVHLTRRNDVHGDEIYDNNETKFQFTFV
ncbi:uncharacterized protein LOC143041866 [Mytilus galloprovincialis]|uniref:uncharacterized protein LOC143041866 n=1 Tax=Mytilus galloprovincialis TaxID=29158 RepID=UPI003F7BF725